MKKLIYFAALAALAINALATELVSFTYDDATNLVTWRTREENVETKTFVVVATLPDGSTSTVGEVTAKHARTATVYKLSAPVDPDYLYLYEKDVLNRYSLLGELDVILPLPPYEPFVP